MTAVNQRGPGGGGGGGGGGALGRNRQAVAAGDSDRPAITAGEAALLAEIPTKFADKPWIVDSSDSPEMPCTDRPVRPSSAAASLQTHPSYTRGLFEPDVTARPVSGAGSAGERRRLQRPKTGGPRSTSYGRRNVPTKERRLTLTGVETISEPNLLTRRNFIQHSLNADLKVKVRVSVIIFFSL